MGVDRDHRDQGPAGEPVAGGDRFVQRLMDGVPPEPPPAPVFRFTLRQLLALTTALALYMALLGIVFPRADLYAGAAGVIAMLCLLVVSRTEQAPAIVHLAWWTILGVYLLACLRAGLR